MSGSAHAVIRHLLSALVRDEPVFLATVITTWGSSPRPAGSLMCWSPSLGVAGSVSGGCIEEDVILQIKQKTLSSENPTILTYGDERSLASNARFKLPCGGQLKILVEPINASQLSQWQILENQLAKRQACYRQVHTITGKWHAELQAENVPRDSANHFSHLMGPTRKLLIIGANPTAEYLATIASQLDFSVTVCDPSPDAALSWHNKPNIDYLACYPDGIVTRDFSDAASAVIAVSHDPRIDDMAMLEALCVDAFYVGAMGSISTSQKRRQRLDELGIKPEQLAKLRAPIGINIGSKTPMEIAVSIAAELIAAYSA